MHTSNNLILYALSRLLLNSQVNIWKIPPNPQKLLQKVFQLILVSFSVLFNILKVYQSRTHKSVFFKMASKMAAISRTWS